MFKLNIEKKNCVQLNPFPSCIIHGRNGAFTPRLVFGGSRKIMKCK